MQDKLINFISHLLKNSYIGIVFILFAYILFFPSDRKTLHQSMNEDYYAYQAKFTEYVEKKNEK